MPSPTIKLISCIGVARELPLLAHFLDHYARLGIDPSNIHVILNAEREDLPELSKARTLLSRLGAAEPVVWIEAYTSDRMWERRRELQRKVASSSDWVVSADVDEFHEYPAPIDRVIAHCERTGANVVQGVFVDRLARDGALPAVQATPSIAEQYPLQTFIMRVIGKTESDPYGSVKVMVMRGDIMPSRGGHHPMPNQDVRFLAGAPLGRLSRLNDPRTRLRFPFAVHHYKWTATLLPGLERRLATPGVSEAGQRYGRQVLQAFKDGRIDPDSVFVTRRAPRARGWRTRMALSRAKARIGR